jgi:hypothetical protein
MTRPVAARTGWPKISAGGNWHPAPPAAAPWASQMLNRVASGNRGDDPTDQRHDPHDRLLVLGRPASQPCHAMSACGLVWLEPARLVTDCLRHRCEWSRLDAELWAQPAPPGHGDMAV